MGVQGQDQDQQMQEDEFKFPDEELSPEDEAALRGEVLDDDQDNDDDADEEIDEAALERLAGDDSPVVSHGRFHEVNENRKAAEAREAAEKARADAAEAELAALRAGQQPAQQQQQQQDDRPTIEDLEGQATDALLEGDTERSKQIRMEINARIQEDVLARVMAEQRAQEAQREARAAAASFDKVISTLEAQYPALDINNPDADLIAIDVVNAVMQRQIAEGKTPAVALENAVKDVAKRFNYEPAGGSEDKPRPRANSNRQSTVVRNANASAMQPPRMEAGMGERAFSSSKKSVAEMSDKDFDNMDPELERKLRGEA